MPQFNRSNVIDPEGREAKEARATFSGTTAKVYDFFKMVHDLSKLKPFKDRRTYDQRKKSYLIKDNEGWEAIRGMFEAEINRYKVVSVDVEKLLPDEARSSPDETEVNRVAKKGRVVYVIFGSMTGRVCIFDIDKMRAASQGGHKAYGDGAELLLPNSLLRLLQDTDIIVAGSDIKDDLEGLNLEVNRMVDTRDVFGRAMEGRRGEPQTVDIGHNTRRGLGAQSFYCRGYDYKTCKASQYIKWYGPHSYTPQWPQHRSPFTLFRWKRRSDGHLPETHLNYMHQDGASVAALVAKLGMDKLIMGSLKVGEGAAVSDVVADILGPNFMATDSQAELVGGTDTGSEEECKSDNSDAHSALELSSSDNDSDHSSGITRATKRAPVQERREELGEGPSQPKQVRENYPVEEERQVETVTIGDDSHESVEVVEAETRVLRGSSFAYWDHDLKRINPYIKEPRFPRMCTFCGSKSHSRTTQAGEPLCPDMRQHNGTDLCTYVRCRKKGEHRTLGCGALPRRCMD